MSLLRRQLPVRSPFPLAAALAPLGHADPRPAFLSQLRGEYLHRTPFLVASGTAALQAALEIVKAERGRTTVAMPAYACYDLATAALGAGVRVRLYDLDPQTLQPDLESLTNVLDEGIAAVVVVHLYGMPVPVREIRALAARRGAFVIEDAAQGIGARAYGEPVGMQGDLAVLSFGRGKGVSGGGGGALLVNQQLQAAATAHFESIGAAEERQFGTTVAGLAQWMLGRPSVYGIPSRIPFLRLGETIFHEPSPVRMMPAGRARTLQWTWPLRGEETRVRVANATALREALSTVAPELVMAVAPETEPGWLRLPLVLPSGLTLHRESAAALGIVPAYPRSLNALEQFAPALEPTGDAFIGARTLAERLWTLPTHGALTAADIGRLKGWMRQVFDHRPAHSMPPSAVCRKGRD